MYMYSTAHLNIHTHTHTHIRTDDSNFGAQMLLTMSLLSVTSFFVMSGNNSFVTT